MGLLRSRDGERQVLLSAVHVVGRMQSSALQLTSEFVSTAHAMIRWDGQSWSIRDLGSRNGTYVNEAVVPKGEAVPLRAGARISFGGSRETWIMASANEPAAALVPADGQEPIMLTQPITGVPSADQPAATVYLEGDEWFLEQDETRVALQLGSTVRVGDRSFRFECPAGTSETAATSEEFPLEESTLVLDVSRDEEHVSLEVRARERTKVLGERTCFYLALVLARRRQSHPEDDEANRGWLFVDDVLRMIPDYASPTHLNVEILRLRRALAQAGVRDAARIIDRRRGQIRLGTERIEVRSRAEGTPPSPRSVHGTPRD